MSSLLLWIDLKASELWGGTPEKEGRQNSHYTKYLDNSGEQGQNSGTGLKTLDDKAT